MDKVDELLLRLSKRKNTLTVFNPYRNPVLTNNLKAYLETMLKTQHQSGSRVMLVGEAPGFKGGRLTGIPFSSGKLLQESDHPFIKVLRPQLELDSCEKENTASMVWQYLSEQTDVPVFWNAFPFHPHPSRVQKKNRNPKQSEIEEGAEYLEMMVEIFKPDQIAGLGRSGVACVEKVFPERQVAYIRHPSYGGKKDFIQGMDLLFSGSFSEGTAY